MKHPPADDTFNVEILQAQIAALREDLAAITATMASGLKGARDKVTEQAGEAMPAAREVEETLEKAVKDHPIVALLFAGLIGFLLGSLTRRK
jgi:ElaB/YqjD/DUF883 family membrane-anchored ribosome-binding protein